MCGNDYRGTLILSESIELAKGWNFRAVTQASDACSKRNEKGDQSETMQVEEGVLDAEDATRRSKDV